MNKITEILNTKIPLISWSVEKNEVKNVINITTDIGTIAGIGFILFVMTLGVTYVN